MKLGFYMCMTMVPVFGVCALFFAIGKEKAANALSGFNFLPKEERAKYDRKRMAADARKDFTLWTVLMLFGALGCLWISGYAAVAAYVLWLILFFRSVHLDVDKAYGKYKLLAIEIEADERKGESD